MDSHLIIDAILRLVPPCGVEAPRAKANLSRLDDAALEAMRIELMRAAVAVGGEPRLSVAMGEKREASARSRLAAGFSKLQEATRLLAERGGSWNS